MNGATFLKEEDAEFQLVEGRPVSFPASPRASWATPRATSSTSKCPSRTTSATRSSRAARPATRVASRRPRKSSCPTLDGEFARQVGEGFASLEALQARVESDLREVLEREAEHQYHDQVVDLLAERAQLDFPPVLVEREVDRLLRDQAGASTGTNRDAEQLERYLHQVGKPVEEIRAEIRPIAERRVRRSLVLSEVAEAEHIDVTGEEVEAEIERLASGAGPQADELRRLFSQNGRRIAEAVG